MASRPKRPRDPNQLAALIVGIATGETTDAQVSKHAAAGRSGGIIGGRIRMGALSDKEKKALALKGATARWGAKKPAKR